MTLTNAIAIIRRQDAQKLVKVPSKGGRKAYEYYRSGNSGYDEDFDLTPEQEKFFDGNDDWTRKPNARQRYEKEIHRRKLTDEEWNGLYNRIERIKKRERDFNNRKLIGLGAGVALGTALALYKQSKGKERSDAKIKVDVPAQNGKKAYSYYREGSDKQEETKTPRYSTKDMVLGGLGAIALVGATIAVKRGIIDGSKESVDTYNQYKENREKVEKEGIPKSKQYAYEGINDDLAKSIYAAEQINVDIPDWQGSRDRVEDQKQAVANTYNQFIEDYDRVAKEGIPKEYAEAYKGMSSGLANSLYAAEQRIKNNNYESVFYFKEDGGLLGLNVGGSGSVGTLTDRDVLGAFAMIHNHPHKKEKGMTPFSPFSGEDLIGAPSSVKLLRVVSEDFIFSLEHKKPGSFTRNNPDSPGFEMSFDILALQDKNTEAFYKNGATVEGVAYFSSKMAVEVDAILSSPETQKLGFKYRKIKVNRKTPRGDSSFMPLSNAIAIIRRQDAKVRVEVPATQGRKAYSYMREGSDNPSTPKSSVSKKAIGGAIAGVVGVGALTAGVLAMRKAKQNSGEASQGGDTVTGSSVKGVIAEGQPTQRKKPLVTPPPVSSDRVLVTPSPKSIKETVKQMTNEGVTATPSKQNAVLTEPKEGGDRDRKSGKTSTKKEVNLNEAAYNAGKKTRKAVEKLATLAKDTVENIKKRSKTVTAKATEVNETALPEGQTMKKAPKAPKVPKLKSPTAAERRATQKQLDDLNK